MTEQDLRNKVVSIAQSYMGCNEADGSHRKIIDLYNSHTPLARGYKVKYTDAWCATFVSAVAIKAGLTDIIPTECGCGPYIELFKKLGSWQENDAYVPKAGDYIFYDWQDSGVGDNVGSPDHVGIVEKVSGKTIYVIEGNYSDSVKRRTIEVNGKYIRGFGVPKYSSKASPTNSEKKEDTQSGSSSGSGVNKGVSDSIKIDSAKYFDRSVAGLYKTTTDLNMRAGAGTTKTIIKVIPGNGEVRNYGYYNVLDGTMWLYVQHTVNGITYTGFCSSKYLKKC